MVKMTQIPHVKLKPGLPWQKVSFNKKTLFHQQTELKLKEESTTLHLEHSFV